MINDNTHRLQIPDGEVRELSSPQGLLWERAVRELKSRLEQAYVTRNNGIKGLKTFGGSPVKRKQDKLWGRYVPAVASDTTTYPMVLENLLNLATVTNGYYYDVKGNYLSNENARVTDFISIELSESYTWIGSVTGGKFNLRISYFDSNKDFISQSVYEVSSIIQKSIQITVPSNASYARISGNYAGANRFNWESMMFVKGTMIPTEYIPYGSVWKFVKDIGSNGAGTDFGYYNDATNEFVKAAGASGSLIQPIAYAESTGTQYVDTELTNTNIQKITFEYELSNDAVAGDIAFYGVAGANNGYASASFVSDGSNVRALWSNKRCVVNVNDLKGRHTIIQEINPDALYIDGNSMTLENDTNSRTGSFTLLASMYGSSVIYGRMKLFQCDIKTADAQQRNYIPVRIGTSVELLDLVNWKFATRTGTFTAGADIPYTQLCPDIIKVNTGDIRYGVGKNLFDYTQTKFTSWENIPTNKVAYTGWNGDRQTVGSAFLSVDISNALRVPVVKGNSVSVKRFNAITGTIRNFVGEFDSNGNCLKRSEPGFSTTGYAYTTTEDNCAYVCIQWALYDTDDSQVMLVEGSTIPTEYEPYAKTIRTNGTHKVIVGSQGVVDIGSLTWVKSETYAGVFNATLSSAAPSAWGVVGGLFTTEYTTKYVNAVIGADSELCIGISPSSILYVKDSRYADEVAFKAAMSGVMLYYQRNTDASYVAPQIREITDLLYSADDYVDIQTGELVRKWGVKVLDGTENWTGTSYFYIAISGMKSMAYGSGLCSHFTTRTSSSDTTHDIQFGCGNNMIYLFEKTSKPAGVTDAASFKAYLASEYAKGTPVIVLYPLATPVTEQVTIAPIASARRTTYVADSESELGKLNLELKFLGK